MAFRIILISVLFLSGCSTTLKRARFDKTKRVQIVERMKNEYIYAQDDIVLDSSLSKILKEEKEDWEKTLKAHDFYLGLTAGSAVLQVATLFGCLFLDKDANDYNTKLTTFCATSILSGSLSYYFSQKASTKKNKVVTEYNKKFVERFENP